MGSNSSQRSPWPPILPQPGELPPLLSPTALPPLRSSLTLVACDNCRRSKVKCSGGRPACRACIRNHRQCIYRTELSETSSGALIRQHNQDQRELQRLRKSHRSLQRIVSALQTRGESEAAAIVEHLRNVQDPEATARQLEGGDLLLQLHVHPETKFRFTFPYRHEIPAALRTPHNKYLKSPMLYSTSAMPDRSEATTSLIETQQPQYFRPYNAAQIVDSRLDKVVFSRWTSVCTDNKLMRDLFHGYLLWDFQTLPPFHKDYFLNDLVSRNTTFCSSLLVNAILAHACTCYEPFSNRVEHWNPGSLGYKFFAEARRLWDMERVEPPSLTTIQAGMVMNYTYNVYSMDQIGFSYGTQAASMAYELNMFEPTDGVLEPSLQLVYDYTAWCLYNCLRLVYDPALERPYLTKPSFQCYYFMVPSPLQAPPATPLPDPETNPEWYGEFYLQYPSNQNIIPVHYPQWTRLKFEIWSILNPVATEIFDKKRRNELVSSQQLYVQAFIDLRNLYSALPAQLSPEKIVFPLHIGVHLWYHDVMINICRLLIPDVREFMSSDAYAVIEAQLAHSKVCFETVLRLHYLRNGFGSGSMFLLNYIVILSFMALRDIQSSASSPSGPDLESLKDTRSTLILAAKGLRDQGQNYYVSVAISSVLQGQMSAGDLDILARYCSSTGENLEAQEAGAEHVKAMYPMNIVKMTNDPETQRLEEMIQRYDNLAVQEES